jgi:putative Mn2+ efflux pump MntP
MTILEVWLLALALAMDCLAVSITGGFALSSTLAPAALGRADESSTLLSFTRALKKVRLKPILTMAFLFGFFQAVMPFIGWIGTKYFSNCIECCDHWIAFALLTFIGGKMFIEGMKGGEEAHFNPTSLKVVIALAVATSIDALAVGISFTCVGWTAFTDILVPILIIGLVSFLFAFAGNFIGIFLGRKFHFPIEQVGGIILILIGVKILLEHLSII